MLWPSPPWDSVTYWALDLETGGLDHRRDPILAVGMVPVRAGSVRLGEAWSSLARPGSAASITPGSITAHQLLPGDVRSAPSIEALLPELDLRLSEGSLLVHQASIDLPFLRRAFRDLGRRWPGPAVVDTVELLVKEARRARFLDPGAPDEHPDLTLSGARQAHGLPPYQGHDALTDAIATAELFLVLRQRLGARTLRDLR